MIFFAVKRPIPMGQHGANATRLGMWLSLVFALLASSAGASSLSPQVTSLVSKYCVDCHDSEVKKAGLDIERVMQDDLGQHSREWEAVVRKLRARQMPPIGKDRPPDKTYDEVVTWLASSLDRVAAKNPNPGRTGTFRRLNRTEYQNVIRGREDQPARDRRAEERARRRHVPHPA